jgi:hypothetical protein
MTLEDRRAEAIERFRAVSEELLIEALQGLEEGDETKIQGLFEGMAHDLGFVEAQVILIGGDAEDLARSKRVARYAGMREALKAHDEDCPGCPGSAALKKVVEAN